MRDRRRRCRRPSPASSSLLYSLKLSLSSSDQAATTELVRAPRLPRRLLSCVLALWSPLSLSLPLSSLSRPCIAMVPRSEPRSVRMLAPMREPRLMVGMLGWYTEPDVAYSAIDHII
ncbi:hypothetical protein DQ04_05361060 [Trypanosoma grayi]|uniref:hypothetical protein n=1 Tax=Trypanosoma grayi TaxID=71804 RepID=UPI0004F4A494|nr:hypothetical protein DQ04_05361060 [Trypanosoma grayi]KEG09358.1 hypothetical protein DQ04_05361060 [Trypanosoma grayi]